MCELMIFEYNIYIYVVVGLRVKFRETVVVNK